MQRRSDPGRCEEVDIRLGAGWAVPVVGIAPVLDRVLCDPFTAAWNAKVVPRACSDAAPRVWNGAHIEAEVEGTCAEQRASQRREKVGAEGGQPDDQAPDTDVRSDRWDSGGVPAGPGHERGDAHGCLEVQRVWKGEVAEVVEVRTATDTAMCGYHFTVGSSDLVYAAQDDDGAFTTYLCGRSAPLGSADEDLAALGEGNDPIAGEQLQDEAARWPWLTVGAVIVTLLAGIAVRVLRRGRYAR